MLKRRSPNYCVKAVYRRNGENINQKQIILMADFGVADRTYMSRNVYQRLRLVKFIPPLPERRENPSELEQAARTLHQSARYLMAERERGDHHSLVANREAIAILCTAAQQLTKEDRRETTRRYTLRWLWDAIAWTK